MGQVNHTQRKHALLSASGSDRWMSCTPSPRFEEEFPEQESSVYAEEGTLAHEFGDIDLRLYVGELSKKQHRFAVRKLKKHELYSEEEMLDEVAKYTEYVTLQFEEAKRLNSGAVLLVERKVDLTDYIENGFGTTDSTIISDGVLEVIDLKYGKGVQVSAEDNSQLKLYGLGSLKEHELLYDIHTVRLTIVQPRLNTISVWEISAEDLLDWAENEVLPRAQQAYAGEGELVAGDHCKWCRAKNRCPALAALHLELAKLDFAEPEMLTDEQLIEIYEQTPQLVNWANSISAYILSEAINGKDWEGYKLVEGKSNRKWIYEEQAIEKLRELKHPDEKIINSKIKGIGDIEKLVKKSNFQTLLGDFVEKPAGKPSLVPASDKREPYALSSAKQDFQD